MTATNTCTDSIDSPAETARQRRRIAVSAAEARIVFCSFVATFAAARTLVHLMIDHHVRTMYLHVGAENTHVHHLNYGIFLLSFIGAYLIFVRPRGRHLSLAAALYGVAMGLTFDEFGMWYHLSSIYWQHSSNNAVTLIAVVFGILAIIPELSRAWVRQWMATVLAVVVVGVFVFTLRTPLRNAMHRLGPALHHFAILSPRR